jgi:hypothetical protein
MSLKALILNAAVPKFTRLRAAEDAGYRSASARQHCALPRFRQKEFDRRSKATIRQR